MIKERVIEAFDNIPKELLSKKLSGIYRMKKSNFYPNPATSADVILALYDTAFDFSKSLERIIVHELAHQNFIDLSEKERQDYRLATRYLPKIESDQKIYWVPRKVGYVAEDGKNSTTEDYANNIEYYLFDSDKLKTETPKAYDWIRKHFGSDFGLKGKK